MSNANAQVPDDDPVRGSKPGDGEIKTKDIFREAPGETIAPEPRLPGSTDSDFVVALSGGGHRASLFALGGLMAIVDSGANKRVRQIASVSGGSITNSVVANACAFSDPTTTSVQFDTIAKCLFATIVRGVLTKPIVWTLGGIALVPPVVFIVAAIAGCLPRPSITIPAILFWMMLIFMRGMPIEWLFRARYFSGKSGHLQLKSLAEVSTTTEHILCSTDLVSGRPVYFSTSNGGRILCPEYSLDGLPIYNGYNAGALPVAAIMRASAGFPGIPPRRLQMVSGRWTPWLSWPSRESGSVVFLSDGGIWNNLGTQAFVEHKIYEAVEYHGDQSKFKIVLCLDASANVTECSRWSLHIPGWAEIKALARQATVSNSNTVAPRRTLYNQALASAIGLGSEFVQPQPLVISLGATPAGIVSRFHRVLSERWLKCGQDVTELEANAEYWARLCLSQQYRKAAADESRSPDALQVISGKKSLWHRAVEVVNSPVYNELCQISGLRRPAALSFEGLGHDYSIGVDELLVGDARVKKFLKGVAQALADCVADYLRHCVVYDQVWRLNVATTLGAIDRETASRLVGRGYANTAVALYMIGLIDTLPSPREQHPWLFSAPSVRNFM